MMQPGRKYSAGDSYRYGFNGKENDNDVKGIEGNQQDYGMRIYDPRLGKFLSVDPLMKAYPSWSPYPFAMNRPIDGIDLDGEEWTKSPASYYPEMGKYVQFYHITINIGGENNQLKLNNPQDAEVLNSISQTASTILSSENASGTENDPITFVLISFSDKGEFKVNFKHFESFMSIDPRTGKETVSGDPFAAGITKGGANTQKNEIDVAMTNSLKWIIDKTLPAAGGKTEDPYTPKQMGRTLAHELGHTAGLKHPWDNNNDIPEIDNDLALGEKGNVSLIADNLMNSAGNPLGTFKPELSSNSGTQLITEQREKISQNVNAQQPKRLLNFRKI